MEPKKSLYHGREQTFVKHLFLSNYLKAAAFKTFQGRSPTFNFVDGFAGPWDVSEDGNLSDTSFAQSIKVLREVRGALKNQGFSKLHIRFCFCEKKQERFNALQKYAAKHNDLEVHLFNGAFEDNLLGISDKCKDGFTFTFIDPTGFNIRSKEIGEFLAEQRGEFLLNFMSEHINRWPDFDDVSAAYGKLLANPKWREEYEKLPSWLSNEQRVLHLLKNALRELEAGSWFPDFRIRNPRKNRTQMRLVFGSFSRSGVETFRNVQKNAELQEIQIREGIALGPQQGLFPLDEDAERLQNISGFGSLSQKDISRHVITFMLEKQNEITFGDMIGDVLEQASVSTSILKDVLVEMKNNNQVDFRLAPRKRKPSLETVISLCNKELF